MYNVRYKYSYVVQHLLDVLIISIYQHTLMLAVAKYNWVTEPNPDNMEMARNMVRMAFVPLPFNDLQEALYAMQLRLVTTLKTETGMRKRANTIANFKIYVLNQMFVSLKPATFMHPTNCKFLI